MKFYDNRKKFESCLGISKNIEEVSPRGITVNPDFNKKILQPEHYRMHETPYDEIKVARYEEVNPDYFDLFGLNKIKQEMVDDRTYSIKMKEAIKKTILETWDSSKFHVVPHSSGTDTRIISLIVKELYEEYGQEWMGEIIFIEALGEKEGFRKIMDIEGWEDEKRYIVDEDEPPNKHSLRALEFKDVWKKGNGYLSYPTHQFYYIIEDAQNRGIIPCDEEIQCYTGYGANEMANYMSHPRKKYKDYFKWQYYTGLAQLRFKGNWISVMHSEEVIRMHYKYGAGPMAKKSFHKEGISFSKILIDELYPETNIIKRLGSKDIIEMGYREININDLNVMYEKYKKSWFGKNYGDCQINTKIGYYEWWGLYVIASFCEYLRENGHDLSYRR